MAGRWFTLALLCFASLIVPSDEVSPFESIYKAIFGDGNQQSSINDAPEAFAGDRVKRQSPNIGDESTKHYEIKTSSLPTKPGSNNPEDVNLRYMPTLGNGYLATTVYGPHLFINSLYNGEGSESHRAAIPAVTMARTWLKNEEIRNRATRKFIFNAFDGTFTETIDCDFAYIEHRTYIHQKYIRVLVSDFYARRKDSVYDDVIFLNYTDINASPDILWEQPEDYYGNMKVRGRTKSSEEGADLHNVYMYFQVLIPSLSFDSTARTLNQTRIMAVDVLDSSAKADFDAVRNIIRDASRGGSYGLLQEHIETWKARWDRGRIEVSSGDTNVNKITTFAQYYLLSSLPPTDAFQQPQYDQVYYGPARTSLAKGSLGTDYQGHRFWDTEMYIMPAVVLFHPDLALRLLRYRSAFAEQAEEAAKAMGKEGYRFPWESGYTGADVTPDTCMECRDQQLFVSAAVSWSIRIYYSATGDEAFGLDPDYNACDMTRKIAQFYASLAVYNPEKGRYDINNVMGPDDWHPNVNNNAFTNVMASLAIHWARYFACICDRNARNEVPDDWLQIAIYLDLPFDNVRRLHYQHEGYEESNNKTLKQADTILLTFPVYWNMSVDIMRHDLEYYEQYTNDRTPAMTHSFYTVGWKWVNERAKLLNSFQKSYQDYTIQPFKVWTEYNEVNVRDQEEGSVNYLPGLAAYLQSLIYGFAGIRIRPEQLEFHNPSLPDGWNYMDLKGLNYRGAEMNIMISYGMVEIEVLEEGPISLLLRRNSTYGYDVEEELRIGSYITIDKPENGFFIYPSSQKSCFHPRDYIYMPWGYSPWISAAPTLLATSFQILISTLVTIYLVAKPVR